MANKQSFTPDEWKKLVEAAMVASIAVTAAEPHGLWGTLKEGFANARGMAEGRASSDELIRAVVGELETAEGRAIARDGMKQQFEGAKLPDMLGRSLALLGDVGRILDTKAPADAAVFKAWIYDNAQRVAEAATEGGFLGFGGVRVSDAEKAALADIAKALGHKA